MCEEFRGVKSVWKKFSVLVKPWGSVDHGAFDMMAIQGRVGPKGEDLDDKL